MYQVFNFSTGRIINKSVFDSEVTSMDHDHTGHLIFCGDAQVCVAIYIANVYPNYKVYLIFFTYWIVCAGMYILSKYELPHRCVIPLSSLSK